jgi:hypothetical protein
VRSSGFEEVADTSVGLTHSFPESWANGRQIAMVFYAVFYAVLYTPWASVVRKLQSPRQRDGTLLLIRDVPSPRRR